MEKKTKKILLSIGILIMLISISALISSSVIKLQQIDNIEINRTWTKAICNSDNYCQDYEISCKDEKFVSMVPITGAAIKFPAGWKDPRNEDMINRLC